MKGKGRGERRGEERRGEERRGEEKEEGIEGLFATNIIHTHWDGVKGNY